MSATIASANDYLNKEFGSTQFTPVSNWYLGLSSSTPSVSGSNFTEPTFDPNYLRAVVPNNKSSFSVSTSSSVVNLITINFPQSSGSWGVMTYLGMFDASASATNHLRHFVQLASPVTISASSVFSLIPGALTLSLT